jgi:hypothetical protein
VFYGGWWKTYLDEKRLNAVTLNELEAARQTLLKTISPQRENRYMAWGRYVLNITFQEGKLASNHVVKLKMFKGPKVKTRFLSMEEALLMAKLGSVYAPNGRRWTSIERS